jgi:uncharacterized lipoprotein YbaY
MRKLHVTLIGLLLFAMLLAACAQSTPEPTQAPTEQQLGRV